MSQKSEEASGAAQAAVTDADVDAIFERGPAGVSDLMAAYESVARTYYSAVSGSDSTVTYAIDTIQR